MLTDPKARTRRSSFEDLFGRRPGVTTSAPGRVNLIGEHTDYNGGFVLPAAIPQRTSVELAVRSDRLVRVWSANVAPDGDLVEYPLGAETPGRGWVDYVAGVTRVLQSAGHDLSGFDVRIESTVPLGSGLSSSAALEVSMMRALRSAFDLPIDDVQVAVLARRAENEFVGAPVGIMDQMAASLAEPGAALLIDTRSLRCERIALPVDAELIVIDSGITHHHASGEYKVRREECRRAASLLAVPELRDVSLEALPRVMDLVPPFNRRARHVVTENARVLATVQAFRDGDAERAGRLFCESHLSMRDDYEVSIPEIDMLVDLAIAESDVFGARLTGGGFGGAIVMLARAGSGRRVGDAVVERFKEKSGREATVLVPEPSCSER